MSPFVEECRREWKRLGVPDLLAEEMATELESDLAEAETDGVSSAEVLGESDPRRFAATWASERGLVSERPQPTQSRKRLWIVLAAVLVLGFLLGVGALVTLATTGVHTSGAPPAQVPEFVGMKARQAVAVARAEHLDPEVIRVSGRTGVVVAQAPAPAARVRRGSTVLLRVGRG